MDLNFLYFPKGYSPVDPPTEKDYFSDDVPHSDGSPMWMISVSNIALQYILDTRDSVLSMDYDEMGGYTKMGVVTLLCFTTVVGYTVLNVAETSLRALAGLVGFVVTVPLLFIVERYSVLGCIVASGFVFSIVNLMGALKGACQIGAGFVASYEMATSTKAHSLPVNELTDIADFGLAQRAEDFINSELLS